MRKTTARSRAVLVTAGTLGFGLVGALYIFGVVWLSLAPACLLAWFVYWHVSQHWTMIGEQRGGLGLKQLSAGPLKKRIVCFLIAFVLLVPAAWPANEVLAAVFTAEEASGLETPKLEGDGGSEGSAGVQSDVARLMENGVHIRFLALSAALWWVGAVILLPPLDESYVRGRRILTFADAREVARARLPDGDDGLSFGGIRLPSDSATSHFAVVGATGSGKTLTLRLLMQSVLPAIVPGTEHRALIYDAKRDVLSLLLGMGISCPVKVLNPFDSRCVSWDIARDCTAPATAAEIATILIPEEEGHNRFFPDAARHLLGGVLLSLMKSRPGAWTFRDLVLIMKSKHRVRRLIEEIPETRDLLEYFEEERTISNIFSTLATKMARFEPIAAAWSRAKESISLRDWITGEYILVLGNDESIRSALDAVNQVIFRRVTELILSQTESSTRRTWLFLDEVREAGKLEGLSRLLTQGRSKGACVVLGFQDIEGLREVYGEKVANELVGQCCNKAILRLESPETAKWASEIVGDVERFEYQTSLSSGANGGSKTVSKQLVKREVALPAEFMNIPPTSPRNGLTGYYLSPGIGTYRGTISGDFLAQALLPAHPRVRNVVPLAAKDQYLLPWSEADLKRLGLTPQRTPKAGIEPPRQTQNGGLRAVKRINPPALSS